MPNHSSQAREMSGGWSSIRTREVPKDNGVTARRNQPLCQPSWKVLEPRAGFEPATPDFVGRCSRPLS